MTTRPLLILQLMLVLGLGSVFLLPKHPELRSARVAKELPAFAGEWYGVEQSVSQGERDSLGPDTEFGRKLYTNGRGDEIYASIVLSGPDMNTSIHRPERCLPGQGWTIMDSKGVTVSIPGQRSLDAVRLHNNKMIPTADGKEVKVENLNYYWFVGHTETTASHLGRTLLDVRDRVFKGYNQRWAYVTVVSKITKNLKPFGRSQEETDKLIADFVRVIYPALTTTPSGPVANAEP